MRTLVTGGTGFVGANLIRRLLRDGHEVHLLVRPGYSDWRIQPVMKDVQIHVTQLEDTDSLAEVVADIRPEWVFHLAVHGAYSWETDVRRMALTNVMGTINLVLACLHTGFQSFVNTGSSSEYGFKHDAPGETEVAQPNSYYAVTKLSGTLFCQHVSRAESMHLPTLRLYSVYGPYEHPRRLVPSLLVRGLAGVLPPLAHPSTARDYVYVDDVSDAYVRAASRAGQELGALYNVGTGVQTSLSRMVEIVRNLIGLTVEPDWGTMPSRLWDTDTWVADRTKISEVLGWQPTTGVAEGLNRTLDWFLGNPDMLEFYGS